MTSAVKDQQRLEAFSKVLDDFERMVVPVMEEVSTRLVYNIHCEVFSKCPKLDTNTIITFVWFGVFRMKKALDRGFVHNLVKPTTKLLVHVFTLLSHIAGDRLHTQ